NVSGTSSLRSSVGSQRAHRDSQDNGVSRRQSDLFAKVSKVPSGDSVHSFHPLDPRSWWARLSVSLSPSPRSRLSSADPPDLADLYLEIPDVAKPASKSNSGNLLKVSHANKSRNASESGEAESTTDGSKYNKASTLTLHSGTQSIQIERDKQVDNCESSSKRPEPLSEQREFYSPGLENRVQRAGREEGYPQYQAVKNGATAISFDPIWSDTPESPSVDKHKLLRSRLRRERRRGTKEGVSFRAGSSCSFDETQCFGVMQDTQATSSRTRASALCGESLALESNLPRLSNSTSDKIPGHVAGKWRITTSDHTCTNSPSVYHRNYPNSICRFNQSSCLEPKITPSQPMSRNPVLEYFTFSSERVTSFQEHYFDRVVRGKSQGHIPQR
ncbi:hypothetical protein EGW08_016942, partial [Elysia chlorotica]